VAGSTKRHRDVERTGAERRERAYEIATAVRAVMTIWEIIWALVRDHVIRGPGPGGLL
jgi:hypothetical protein